MTNQQTVGTLNDLLTKAYDAEQGYAHAADKVAESSPFLASFFKNQSELRLEIGHELKTLIGKYGGEPDKGASAAAKAHQIWITVKDLVTGSSEEAILEECERGEGAALEEYNEAITKEGLPEDVRTCLLKQRNRISSALAEVRAKEEIAD